MTDSERPATGRSGRWLRREQRRGSEQARIRKHGASLRHIYAAAIRKRLKGMVRRTPGV